MQPHKKNQYGRSRREQRADDIKDREWMIEWHKEHPKGFRALSGEIVIYTVPNPYKGIDNAKRTKARRIKPYHRTNDEEK